MTRLPSWLKKRMPLGEAVHSQKKLLRQSGLHTVCEEARCPNIGECFARGTATFLIMGDICTRHCGFCAIKNGAPIQLDDDEPKRVARQIKELGLKHAVVTSVTRDDISDGGALHFAKTIEEIRKLSPATTIEVLTPDFFGNKELIAKVCSASPDIFNHNIETVERLTPVVRNRADYRRSLKVLATAKEMLPSGKIKSGIMLGLGETDSEILSTLTDMKNASVRIVTVGQYLMPKKNSLPVAKYYTPAEFEDIEKEGMKLGFEFVFAGPFVRSSYMADVILKASAEGFRDDRDPSPSAQDDNTSF